MTYRLAGYQPQYFPRLHYFARILNADIFKISDNLQYVRKHAYPTQDGKAINGPSYQSQTPIKMSHGAYLLSVPVRHEGDKTQRFINTVALDNSRKWQEKHLRSIEISYSRAPRFKQLFPGVESLLSERYDSLAACNIATIAWSLSVLFELPHTGTDSRSLSVVNHTLPHTSFRLQKMVRMSEVGMTPADKEAGQGTSQWIIETCKTLGAKEYYMGGTASSAYIDREQFQKAGITLVEQNWHCREYSQLHGPFIPNLSILDLLMNVSPKEAREILRTPPDSGILCA